LITTAEQKINSGLAGLLVSTVPIFATIITSLRGDHSVWQFKRIVGIVVGFLGLILVVGIESITGSSDPLSIAMVILASMGYAYAVIMVTSNLPLVDGIAINGLAMALTTIFWAPVAIAQWPSSISMNSALSLIALGVFSTAIAFILFFKLMDEIGPARGSFEHCSGCCSWCDHPEGTTDRGNYCWFAIGVGWFISSKPKKPREICQLSFFAEAKFCKQLWIFLPFL
jgi:drug/metabolite transporter (DMT)-like permease